MDTEVRYTDLKLAGLTQLDDLFQEHLAEVAQIFEEAERYETPKDLIEAEIVLEVRFQKLLDDDSVMILVRSKLKRPKIARRPHRARMTASVFQLELPMDPALPPNPGSGPRARRTDG